MGPPYFSSNLPNYSASQRCWVLFKLAKLCWDVTLCCLAWLDQILLGNYIVWIKKVKVKMSPYTPWRHKGEYWYTSCHSEPRARRSRVVSFTPRPLYPRRKRPGYPLNMRLGGPRTHCGRFGAEESLLCLLRIEQLLAGCLMKITKFLRDVRPCSLVHMFI